MLVSVKSLRKLVDIDNLTGEEIANGLTFAGIEVEGVTALAFATKLVIGHIIECVDHPDSNHLHVLKVDLGPKLGIEQIVCGAPNARKGLKVIVAVPGCQLNGGTISKGVIRGVESNGMCCSLLELGVDAKYLTEKQTSGIEELPEDAPVGEENVLGYLGLDDEVLDLKILANRPDLLSLINVAKEVAAIFERKLNLPETKDIANVDAEIIVGSETDKCSQFSSREINNIEVKDSPKWMKEFLMSMGVRSINNIVDIGNYVMLMTGQPLHMYDANKLDKKELIARDDYEGDFVALDEKTYKISKGDIVITSNGRPMCLGGVMGALECAVDANTENIYIESASFDAATVRRTSARLGLSSESSMRFVKGTNHFQSEFVLNFTAELVKELCGADKISKIATYQSETKEEQVIETSVYKINNRLGTNFTKEEIKKALERLHFEIKEDGEKLLVTVPDYRLDVTGSADLSEEVIRLLGFEHVNSVLPCLDTTLGTLNDYQAKERLVRDFLIANGLDECLTYSLVSEKESYKFAIVNNDERYEIMNPLTDDRKVFRGNVLHSLLMSASYNVARQNKDLALFEVSNIVTKNANERHLAIVLCGNEINRGIMETTPYDFFHMKGIFEAICELLGIEPSRYKLEVMKEPKDELHPGKSADIIVQGKKIGSFGCLHPNMLKEYDFGKNSVVVLEMKLDELFQMKVGVIKNKPISKFPLVKRDLALVVDKKVLAKDLIRTIKQVGKSIVKNAEIFDVYEGEGVEQNKKSIAISISYGNEDHTLSEKEVSNVEEQIKFQLAKVYGAALRG